MSGPVTSEMALLVDAGSAWTKATVVAKGAGRWRVAAHVAQPTGWAVRDMRRALTDQLAGSVDPRLTGDLDDLFSGANRMECRTPSRARQLAIVGVSREQSGAIARRAAEAAGWDVVDMVTLDDGRTLAERLDRLSELRPDAWLLTGGSDAGEPERAIEAVAMVAASRRPGGAPLMWAGPSRLFARVAALFPADDIAAVQHPGSGSRSEDGAALRARVEELLREGAAGTSAAGASAADPGSASPGAADEGETHASAQVAFQRAVAALARVAGLHVLGVDVGSRYATRVMGGPGVDTQGRIYAGGGLAGVATQPGAAGRIARMLAQPIDELVVADVLQTLRAHPATVSHTIGEMLVTQAAAQLQLAALMESDPIGGVDLVIGAGRTIAAAPTAAQAAQMLVDGLRPLGVTQLALDAACTLAPVGSLTDAEVVEGIELLSDDVLVPLGTAIVCRGGEPGRLAMRVTMHRAGWPDPAPIEVRTGGLHVVRLPAGQQAELLIELGDGVSLGAARPSARIQAAAAGGSVGLIIDARGVPIGAPRRADDRRAVLAGWAETFQREHTSIGASA